MHILNAFSINMLSSFPADVRVEEIGIDQAREMAAAAVSAVGHADTAAVFTDVLGIDVPSARVTVRLSAGDSALVGQYVGPRLPEGATSLPEGATIRWFRVTVA